MTSKELSELRSKLAQFALTEVDEQDLDAVDKVLGIILELELAKAKRVSLEGFMEVTREEMEANLRDIQGKRNLYSS